MQLGSVHHVHLQPEKARLQRPHHRPSARRACQTQCSVKARWRIDIKYGMKPEAISLLQEWVQAIGSKAGLNSQNTAILSGAVGVPESRLELEVTLDSLYELENFWQSIPQQEHKAWSQRAQHFLVDGSPTWDIYRTVDVRLGQVSTRQHGIALPQPAAETLTNGLIVPQTENEADVAALLDAQLQAEETSAQSSDVSVMLDWKGDPMQINPGDKLPFNFR